MALTTAIEGEGSPVLWRRFALVMAAILAFRIVALALNGTDLFFDESQYWAWSREPAFGYYSKPPLIAWIIGAATALCGDGEFCIRLPAPLIHTATAFLIALLGRQLYSDRVGFWSGIVFATLPGTSVSAGIMSTDVPLLFAWALALVAFVRFMAAPSAASILLLGFAFGLGLNAKYAMLFFLLCLAGYFWIEPAKRALLRSPSLYLALALGGLLIVPNLIWNAAHSFATFSHTADNANWEGRFATPGKGVEFLIAQFGVFGPILFGTLLVMLWRIARKEERLEPPDRLLLAFSLPVLAVIAAQAFISRAHPNWAAVAYVPATVLVTAYMLRRGEERWFNASLALHIAAALVIAVATWRAGHFALPGIGDPFQRTLGNRELAAETIQALSAARETGRPFKGVVTDDRELTASLLYYARSEPTPLYAWRSGPRPHDHFEMQRPYIAGQPEPLLLVSRKADPSGVTGAFVTAEPLGARSLKAGDFTERTIYLFALSGARGP